MTQVWRHYAKSRSYGPFGKGVRKIQCDTDQQPWPCDAEQMRLDLDAERARTVVLERALRELANGAANIAMPRSRLAAQVKKARAALAVLPVDRVGVEPLDVERLARAMWLPAPSTRTRSTPT